MSLPKLGSRIKEAGKELTSVSGIKHLLIQVLIGFALGVGIDLALEALIHWVVEPRWKNPRIIGIKIFPQSIMPDPNAPANSVPYLAIDDIVLIISSIALLLTKKVWFVVGYTLGWYISSYMAFYQALHLPLPEPLE